MPGPLYGITLPSYTASRHWQAAAFCWRLYCRWNRALANALSLPNKNHKCTGSGQEHVAALANGCWQDASAKEKSKNPKGGGGDLNLSKNLWAENPEPASGGRKGTTRAQQDKRSFSFFQQQHHTSLWVSMLL